ncbi:PhoU domain-containing protein [Prosthecochloris sp. HL-130-GSB]|jgi:phosphate uptake regulator|uniref:phosphate signaling complex PhoU family protein n=1 Tax=Prosthecochloris sp. HL-130-GSB TaxID=1974213 RepID=UPI000A1C05D7|nr:PhoU domain-containing protein [Prosthecochloris sp. HL-130-GSB]ARM31006.1 PhoU family transcriptional regulator [Prosthecochloris sp. HL-130-GSB]
MLKLFGKKSAQSGSGTSGAGISKVARPDAFTIKIDPQKFKLSTKPAGPAHEQLETLRQKLTKLSSNVENNLMLAIRAATKKNLALAQSAFEFDKEYIQKGKFEVEYMCLAYSFFQDLEPEEKAVVDLARQIMQKLEIMGQYALNIADKTEYIQLANVEVLHKDEYDLKPMGDITAEMIKKVVEAFASGNRKHAAETLEMMKEIQEIYDKAVEKLKNETNDSNITNFTGILSVVEHVKMCADISCDIARMVMS